MGYAVYHTEKGNINPGGIGSHIDRTPGVEHSYRHSDPDKRHLNESFIITEHCKKSLHQAISDRIKEGYNARNKAGELKQIRKDAVKYSTHILTGSHEEMKKIESNLEELKKWIDANLEFASQEFGKENIVRFVIHRDEKTPHIHCVTVNLTKDGRLSAKEIIGNKEAMQERQDRYAAAMKSFGLNRGIKHTGIKHEDAREYYARMQNALNVEDDTKEMTAKKTILGMEISTDYKTTAKNLKASVRGLKTALKSKDEELSNLKSQYYKNKKEKEGIYENNNSSKDTSIMLKKETIDYIKDFLAYKTYVKGDLAYTRMKFFEEAMNVLEEKYELAK